MKEGSPKNHWRKIRGRFVSPVSIGVAVGIATLSIISTLKFSEESSPDSNRIIPPTPRAELESMGKLLKQPINVSLDSNGGTTSVPDPEGRLNFNGNSFEIGTQVKPDLPASSGGSEKPISIMQKGTPDAIGYHGLYLVYGRTKDGFFRYFYEYSFPFVLSGNTCETHTVGVSEAESAYGKDEDAQEALIGKKVSFEEFAKLKNVTVAIDKGKVTIYENGKIFTESQFGITSVSCENKEPLKIGGKGVGIDRLIIKDQGFSQLVAHRDNEK